MCHLLRVDKTELSTCASVVYVHVSAASKVMFDQSNSRPITVIVRKFRFRADLFVRRYIERFSRRVVFRLLRSIISFDGMHVLIMT